MNYIILSVFTFTFIYFWFLSSEAFSDITYLYVSNMFYWIDYKIRITRKKILGSVFEKKQISCFVEEFVNDYLLSHYQYRGEGVCWIDVQIIESDETFEKWNGNTLHLIDPAINKNFEYEMVDRGIDVAREVVWIYQFNDLSKESNIILLTYMLVHELSHGKRKNKHTQSLFSRVFYEAIVDWLSLQIYQDILDKTEKIKQKNIKKALLIAKKLQKNQKTICFPSKNGIYRIDSQYQEYSKSFDELIFLIMEKSGKNEEEIRKIFVKAYLTDNAILINDLFSDAFGDLAFFLCPILNNQATFQEIKESIDLIKERL